MKLDLEQAESFLRLIDPVAQTFTLQTFDDDRTRKTSKFAGVFELDTFTPELLSLHADGAGVYLTVNQTDGKGRKSQNITRIRAVWQEDDDGFEGEFPLPPSLEVETSEGHYHRYWFVADDWPADVQGRADFAAVMQRMVTDYGCDKNAKDLCRVLRVPGFYHRKGQPRMVCIVGGNRERYTRAQILKAFPPPAEERPKYVNGHANGRSRHEEVERIRDALRAIPSDDYDTWLKCGMAIKSELGDAGFSLFHEWSQTSIKFGDKECRLKWASIKPTGGVTIATLFALAGERGRRGGTSRTAGTASPGTSQTSKGPTIDDFYAYLPDHKFIHKPTGALWPAKSVDETLVAPDQRSKPSVWLDRNRPVHALSWLPGEPPLVENTIVTENGRLRHLGCHTFNRYVIPNVPVGDPDLAGPWLDHIKDLYGDEGVNLIVPRLAHRVQRPAEKINHAMVWGGDPGIGKDTILAPVRYVIGEANMAEASPQDLTGKFTSFKRAIILRISEARDLGEVNRYALHEHTKTLLAAPPETLTVNEKFLPGYSIPNVVFVIFTTNHPDALYLPADDRRHLVLWSDLPASPEQDASAQAMHAWYARGGNAHVAAYLHAYDLSKFNPKAPPPKTTAFWQMVNADRGSADNDLADVLEDELGKPAVVTLEMIRRRASVGLVEWLDNPQNYRATPKRMAKCGYVLVPNPDDEKRGRWKRTIGGKSRRITIYGRHDLTDSERLRLAQQFQP